MFKSNVDLRIFSNYKIGGGADYFYKAKNVEDLKRAVAIAQKNSLPVFILGGGTNLLINDSGVKGLVLKPEIKNLEIEKINNSNVFVRVGAGVLVSEFLNFLISKSFSGMEWAGGLPGTVGGAIRGNAGAFGGEIKDSIAKVLSMDISGKKPRIVQRGNKECKFGYRNSIFKINDGREIIFETVFQFQKGDRQEIKKAIEEKIAYRNSRHPMDYPNIGSIFKNTDLRFVPKSVRGKFTDKIKNDPFPVLPTAVLLAEAGLKGISCGGAMISPRHPNFIVNTLGASASDVKALIKLAKASVKKKFGVELEEEIIYL